MLLRWPVLFTTILGIAVPLAATAHAGGRAHRITGSTGTKWVTLLGTPAIKSPTGLAIDSRGNPNRSKWAYVADAATQRIVKFGTSGRVLGSWQYGPLRNRGSSAAVAVGGSGNVFVAVSATGHILKYSPSGMLLSDWGGFRSPRALALDPPGNVYVAEFGAHRVTKLSPAGSVLLRWDLRSLWGGGSTGDPTGVAIAPSGYIYIASTCTVSVTCGIGADTTPHSDMVDGLLEILARGARQGYLMEIWFGVGHSFAGLPQGGRAKEQEPFVTVDAITNDHAGNLYVGGTIWPLGGQPAAGVLAYSNVGYKWGIWRLSARDRVTGIAVDGRGSLYVSQNGRVVKLIR